MAELTTKSITAEDTWTDTVLIEGYFNFSVSGTFVGTVTVQRSYDGINWNDVDSFTDAKEEVGFDPEYRAYRAGVKSGDYTSGTINLRFGIEDRDTH